MLAERAINSQVNRVRRICDRFPEVEVRSREHHGFLVRGKRFASYLIDYRGDGRVALQCKAERGVNGSLVASDPGHFFLPAYMAHHGWIGIYLDRGPVDWGELEVFLCDAYRLAAPKTLARMV